MVTTFLAACEGFPVNNDGATSTIANMPSIAQKEAAAVDDLQPSIQNEENGSSEEKQSEPLSKPIIPQPVAPEPVIKQSLSKETPRHNNSEKDDPVPENVSPEIIAEKSTNDSQDKAVQKKDLGETDLKHQSEASSLPEPLTSNEIASLINMPPSIYATPPLERLRIGALLNIDSNALKSIMGAPNFLLGTEETKLWQYDVNGCIIDFFLLRKKHDYFVTFIDIRAKMLGNTINEQACESELTQALNS